MKMEERGPRQAVQFPNLKVFKVCLVNALSSLVSHLTLLGADWNRGPFEPELSHDPVEVIV